MEFNLLAFVGAVGCCLVSIILAGTAAAKKENKEWLENLNQPKPSFVQSVMMKYLHVLGIVFYLLFGYVLYQLIVGGGGIFAIVVTVTIVQLMGLAPFLLYTTKKWRAFFYVNSVSFVLLIFLIFLLLESPILAVLVAIYLLWYLFDFIYWYRLMKLNE